jgi:hypothetical protein
VAQFLAASATTESREGLAQVAGPSDRYKRVFGWPFLVAHSMAKPLLRSSQQQFMSWPPKWDTSSNAFPLTGVVSSRVRTLNARHLPI